jgi:hypothetical protein
MKNPEMYPANMGNDNYPLSGLFYQEPNDDNTYILNLNMSKLQNNFGVWFLSCFLFLSVLVYFLSSMMFKASMGENYHIRMAQMLDIFVFSLIILYVIVDFYWDGDLDVEKYIMNRLGDFAYFLNNSYAFIILFFFMAVFYLIIYAVGLPMDDNKSKSIWLVETCVMITAVLLLIIWFFKHILNIDLVDITILNNFPTPTPVIVKEEPEVVKPKKAETPDVLNYYYNSNDENGYYEFDVKVPESNKNMIIPDINSIENKLDGLNGVSGLPQSDFTKFYENTILPPINTTFGITNPDGTLIVTTPPIINNYNVPLDITTPPIIGANTTPGIAKTNTTPDISLAYTTPGQTTPGQTTPCQTTPGLTTPGQTTPGQTTPGLTTPGQTTPGQTTPGLTTPGQKTPGQTTPGNQNTIMPSN